jgi:hypothetical protein
MEIRPPGSANGGTMQPERRQGMLRLRMIADFILVGAFGLAAPAMLAPIGRNWGVMLIGVATFAIGIAFLWDGLRMVQRLHR